MRMLISRIGSSIGSSRSSRGLGGSEVNSGASFEQYFRWASIEELQNIEAHLAALELHDAARLLRRALEIAFPRGLPATEDEKSEATEWTSEQEDQLASLFGPFESENGAITNALAAYARTNQL